MTYDEAILLPARYKKNSYMISEGNDGKIYNIDLNKKKILYIRDPNTLKFKIKDIVLIKPLGEYGEIIEIKQDLEWGNHQYDIMVFNDGIYNTIYRDENELEGLPNE